MTSVRLSEDPAARPAVILKKLSLTVAVPSTPAFTSKIIAETLSVPKLKTPSAVGLTTLSP